MQIIGWLTLTILTYLALTVWYDTYNFWPNNIHGLLQSALGILFSLILRQVFLYQWEKPYISRTIIGFISVIIVALLWTVIRIQLYLLIVPLSPEYFKKPDWVFNKASIFFNFGVDGANIGDKKYYWDDMSFGSNSKRPSADIFDKTEGNALQQIDLPINFEQKNVNYLVSDFGGTYTTIGADPSGRKGNVAITTKNAFSELWAGSTIGTNSGFANAIPITRTNSTLTVWVYSSDAGIPVLLKLENNYDVRYSAETQTKTTKSNTWEPMIFDFNTANSYNVALSYAELWKGFGGWYFTSLLIFLCWAASYHGIKYAMLFQLERDEATGQAQQAKLLSLEASEAAKEAQLQMLRYQLNPHFMFNTLNAIYALIKLGDQDQAKDMVSKLGKFLRYPLNNDNNQLVSLSEELEAIYLYLDIEKVRFGNRLTIKTDIEPVASLFLVPSLILQPLVENAIKYAVAKQENGGTITITGKVRKKQLILTVSDDGPGADLFNGKLTSKIGIGLRNTQQRLETLFGAKHSFSLENVVPHGFRIVMCLPTRKRL
ncbi:sensor histidine kinase [Paraglaciecola sp. MB-3u-78]|uniref:sensor histidine kinase n=1 Tax=Paraglaciecola sp. MB-3u-78 TaxID=2058332 RepID=UPI000C339930|nr:histidine kinase [Paraglaciecola sp. MB-3u-78]PKH00183.1 hypothetical protein CXF95_06095 [Paraglaciecola sp. MB-3u-78]